MTVTNSDDIGTLGRKAAGIFAQSVGGGGGNAQSVQNILVGKSAEQSSRNAVLIGGSGGTGGASGAVEVSSLSGAQIVTAGDESHGVFAQSVGGGGGNGSDVLSVSVDRPGSSSTVKRGFMFGLGGSGGTGGTGGTVDVINDGLIETRGDRAHGVLAQSVGGGGGNGGYSVTGTLALQTGKASDPTISLNIGGSGGAGNTAGDVTVGNTGVINVLGTESYGVLAQSIGGGGGNGGFAASLDVNNLIKQAKGKSYTSIAVGGFSGVGADAGDVTVNHSGTINVRGRDSFGIFAQSVGGGGGNAGLSLSTPAVMVADFAISTLLGAVSTDGKAGTVTVNTTGDIIVTGEGSQAMFTQSVNGGGGNVNTFLDFTDETTEASGADADVPVTSALNLGGEDVDGTAGAAVKQSHKGDILTTADRSGGALLQSIGGGGGNASTTVRSGQSGDIAFNAMLGARNTDDAPGGDVTSERVGSVGTTGDLSGGGTTQSIGGGGGRLVLAGGTGTGNRTGSFLLGADPSFRNDGGDVSLTLSGVIETMGDNSSGQVVQSIGAGGGETYLSGLDQASVTIGASDESTGDGGAVRLSNSGDTRTSGERSHGFVLQSIGGGGGLVGTDLDPGDLSVTLSAANGGDGGDIGFANSGSVIVTGNDFIGVLAQSLGGGGGSVDGIFRGSAGGKGSAGDISLDLNGNLMSLGKGGIAVMAQSDGANGAGDIDIALDGVIIGGSGGRYMPARKATDRAGKAGRTSGTAAVVIDGGADNRLDLSADSFLMSRNNRILSGGSGNETVSIAGQAVGNVDLGSGLNNLTVTRTGAFYAQKRVDLGARGHMQIDGDLYLGGTAFLPSGSPGSETKASDFRVTENVIRTTDITGSLTFGSTATYTPDVSFGADGPAGSGSDLIRTSGDATLAGTIYPVLNLLQSTESVSLIEAGGRATNAGVTIPGTPVLTYSIEATNSPGNSGTLWLNVDADFTMPGMNRNQTNAAEHIATVLDGEGSADMAPLFGLIANMQTQEEVLDAVDRLTSEDYAATLADTYFAVQRFADINRRCDYYKRALRAEDERSCLWLSPAYGSLSRNSSSEYRKLKSDTTGISAGARVPLGDDFYLGVAASHEDIDFSSGDRFSANGKRMSFGMSLSRYEGPWEFYGTVSGGWGSYRSRRSIGINGSLPNGTGVSAETAKAKQKVWNTNLRVGTSYTYQPESRAFYVKPGLDLDATFISSGSTKERGTDYGLELGDTDQWVLTATPSLELGKDVEIDGGGRLRGFLRGGVSFSDTSKVHINSTFAGASGSDGTFRNYSKIGGQRASLIAGATITSPDDRSYLSVGFRGDWGGDGLVGTTGTMSFGLRF